MAKFQSSFNFQAEFWDTSPCPCYPALRQSALLYVRLSRWRRQRCDPPQHAS